MIGNKKGNTTIKITTPKLVIGGLAIFLIAFFLLSGGDSFTGNFAKSNNIDNSNEGVVEVRTTLQGFKYNPDVITVKNGDTIRLIIDNKDNVLHGLHLPQFGIVDSTPPLSIKVVEFKAIETSTNGQAVPTCSREHGETLTFNVV